MFSYPILLPSWELLVPSSIQALHAVPITYPCHLSDTPGVRISGDSLDIFQELSAFHLLTQQNEQYPSKHTHSFSNYLYLSYRSANLGFALSGKIRPGKFIH